MTEVASGTRRAFDVVAEGLAWLVVAVVSLPLLRAAAEGAVAYLQFADRELVRAAMWREVLPTQGSELSGGPGARIPGALLGLLFGAPRLVSTDLRAVFALQTALAVAGLGLLRWGVGRVAGPAGGAAAAALLATHPAFTTTVDRLWNPGFMIAPAVGVTVALVVGAQARSAQALPWLALAGGLGAQVHLAMGLWASLAAAVVAAQRPPGLRPAAARAGLVLLVVYSPFLLHELVTGAPTVVALAGQLAPDSEFRPRGLDARRVATALGAVVGDVNGAEGPAWAWWGPVGLAALALRERAGRWLALAVGLAGLAAGAGMTAHLELRYVLPAVVGASALAGLGARGRLGWGLAAAALVAAWMRGGPLAGVGRDDGWGSYPVLLDVLERLRETTGWSDADIAGRTVWTTLGPQGEPGEWRAWPPIEHLLWEDGLEFPGSGWGPCALMLRTDDGFDVGAATTPQQVSRWLGLRDGAVTAARPHLLAPGVWFIAYDKAAGACPTSMVNRYIDTRAERRFKPLWGELGCGEVAEVPGAPRMVAVGLCYDGHEAAALLAAVTLEPAPDGVRVTLHSNGLRGLSDNGAWLGPAQAWAPTVWFEQGDGLVPCVLDPGYVGSYGALTPLTCVAALGAGTWRVGLDITLFPPVSPPPYPPEVSTGRPVVLQLGEIVIP